MPKRISKKLLVGLGSIITFGTVGTVSGFGIKSIIDSTWNNRDINQLNSSNQVTSFNQIPDFNVATKDMFIKTKNLKRFHFGNTQIGQKVTPWGWLGVFEDDGGIKTRIALTGWNGEIIWVNEDYSTLDELNVYDMQYDFGSNLIFVLRTKSNNGFYDKNETYPEVYLQVLDAKTGKRYTDEVEDSDFESLQREAKKWLINVTSLLDGYESNVNLQKKTKNLYYLDLTYSSQKNAILATWMPNYMQMARQKEGTLPTFWDVINTWDKVAASFMFDKQKLENGEKYNKKERQFDLFKSTKIDPVNGGQGNVVDAKIWKGQAVGSPTINASEIFLLTNPFFTTSHDGNAFVIHLIGATRQGDVYHKTIGWKIDLSNSAARDGEIYRYTTNPDNLLDQGRYDNIQIIEANNNLDLFNLKTDESWIKAAGWEPSFINANLRVNKNMFDENSIVFAYPYSSSSDVIGGSSSQTYGQQGKAMPVFNVVQIWLEKNNAQIKKTKETTQKDNINYNFGKQIDDYYTLNKGQYSDPAITNNIYPYPTPLEFDEDNVNHSYNRLISVSPFDNTIIYAAKPNVRDQIFGPYDRNQKNKWAGFWIANTWDIKGNNKKKYHPLIIGNDASIVSSASDTYDSQGMEKMLNNINDLYHDGFTFDVASAYEPANFRLSLNLYFNQTGTGTNTSYENKDPDFKTSKIGVIRDILYDSGSHQENDSGYKGWGKDVVSKYPGSWDNYAKKLFATTINNDSFSSLIHSRADLKKWYPRTWANINWPSNMLRPGEIFSYQAPWKYAVAIKFNEQLKDQDWVFTNKESIDLVSAWKDINENEQKYNNRFNRLIIRRPTIKAGSSALNNGLNLDVRYELSDNVYKKIIGKRGWEIRDSNVRDNLTLIQNIAVENTSIQILSAWNDSYKMKKIAPTTNQINKDNTYWNEEITVTEFLDKKTDSNLAFAGGKNNNMTRNSATVLRLMLKLVKPTGNLPQWFNGINESTFFNKAYPIEAAFTGETTFKDIVEKFANERARLMDLSQESNAAVGLGNLKIEASLDLNPKFGQYTSTDKFYNGPSGKILIDKTTKQKFIYTDNRSINRIIYDQSSTDYPSFTTNGGFGSSTTDSWSNPNDLNGLTNIKVTTDYSKLADKLVRKNAGDTTPIFSFDYQNGKKDVLEITPTQGDSNWFINHFKNYNRMIGLFVQFQYQLSGSDQWIDLNTPLTDDDISSNLQANQNKLLIQKVPINIKKLRFKLVTKQGETNPVIDMQNFEPNNKKYTSDAHQIASENISLKLIK